jgi:arylsulfatase A-like enzyme
MNRSIRLLILFLLFLPIGIHAEEHETTSVFVIVADDLTWKMIDDAETPNLDFLRRFGVEATNVTSVEPPELLPNTISMFTGLLPEHHGVTWNTINYFHSYRARTLFECLNEFDYASESIIGNRTLLTLAKPLTRSFITTVTGDHAALWSEFKKTVGDHPNTPWFVLQLPGSPDVDALDRELGALLQLMTQQGRLDRSVILVTAGKPTRDRQDHSAWILWGKNILHRDPLTEVSVVDIMPTLLALFGLSAGDGLDGIVREPVFEQAPNISTLPVCTAAPGLNELFLQMIRVAVFGSVSIMVFVVLLYRMRRGKKPPPAEKPPTPPTEPVRIIRL